MILPDVNVLVYAHREDAVDHTRYRQWLEEIIQSGQPYGISDHVLSGFLRVVTCLLYTSRHLREIGVEVDLVAGVPRGGVIVAGEVARILKRPLGVIGVRKIGHPRCV